MVLKVYELTQGVFGTTPALPEEDSIVGVGYANGTDNSGGIFVAAVTGNSDDGYEVYEYPVLATQENSTPQEWELANALVTEAAATSQGVTLTPDGEISDFTPITDNYLASADVTTFAYHDTYKLPDNIDINFFNPNF